MSQLIPAPTLRKGSMIATLSAAFFGSSVVFAPYAYGAGVLPGTAIFLRFALAALVLSFALTLSRQWIILTRQQILAVFLLGFLSFSVLGITYYVALSMSPAWLIALFTAFYPVTVNLGAWLFLKERFGLPQLLALGLVVSGTILLFWQPLDDFAWGGVLLMIVNVFMVAVYILVGQHWTRGIPPAVSTTWIVTGAACGTLLYALAVDEFSFNFAPMGWLWATGFAVISTVLAISFLWWSIHLIGSSRASIIGSFEPLFGVVLAVLLLGERLSWLQGSGGILILTGMVLVQWQSQKMGK